MSRYHVRSNTGCDHWSDEPCERCDGWRERPIAMPAAQSFGEHVLEHMFHPWETPYPVTSREQLRQECEKREVYSHYLRDSMGWHSGPRRWI